MTDEAVLEIRSWLSVLEISLRDNDTQTAHDAICQITMWLGEIVEIHQLDKIKIKPKL